LLPPLMLRRSVAAADTLRLRHERGRCRRYAAMPRCPPDALISLPFPPSEFSLMPFRRAADFAQPLHA